MQISKEWIKSDLLRVKQYVHPWYKPAQFHRSIAHELQFGKQDLAVIVPPQFGKSEIIAKTFPAYFIAENPTKTVISSSYNQEYANKFSVICSDFFTNEKFQKLFDVKPHDKLWNHRERMLKDYNGGMLFTGVGSGTTGNPADLFLLDDLTKDYEDASSKAKQEALWLWYNMVCDSRLQDEDSRKVIIMTRWLKNDLIGKIQNQEIEKDIAPKNRMKIIRCGALMDSKTGEIAEKSLLDEVASDHTEKKHKLVYSLWPEKKSIRFLVLKYKKEPSVFLTMYQGNPKDLEGHVINPDWIKYENDIKSLGERKYSCRGWDFGYTETGNYTVGSRIDVYETGDMILPRLADVKRYREKPSKIKEIVIQTAIQDGKDVIVAGESGGTQIPMMDDLINRKELFDYTIKTIIPKGDKISRAMPWILKLEDGVFKFIKGIWNKMVVDSLSEFGENCEFDDIEDSITTSWKILFGG